MKKYQIIYADPPWAYNSKQPFRESGVRFNPLSNEYNTMNVKKLQELKVSEISDNDCALFMWSTDSHMKEAIGLIEAWGFKYVTIAFVWEKVTNKGSTVANIAPWTMKNYEICLLGIKGSMQKYKQTNNIYQKVVAVRNKHSQKPDIVRNRIVDLLGDLPRIELFCRGDRDEDLFGYNRLKGWDIWGNEVESDIELGG